MNTNIVAPSMKSWEAAWGTANIDKLKNCYSASGVVLPPNRAILQGPSSIVDFFKGGINGIYVRFYPEKQVVSSTLAYEFGIVKDYAREGEAIVETCHYAVTWVLEDGAWKIQLHTWTIAID